MENLDNELTAKRAEKKAKHSPTSLPGESSSSSSLTDTSSIDEDAESTELCTSRSRVPKENNQSSDNKNRLKDRSSSRSRSKSSSNSRQRNKKRAVAETSEQLEDTSNEIEFPFSNPLLANNAQKRRPAIMQKTGILKNNYFKDADSSANI